MTPEEETTSKTIQSQILDRLQRANELEAESQEFEEVARTWAAQLFEATQRADRAEEYIAADAKEKLIEAWRQGYAAGVAHAIRQMDDKQTNTKDTENPYTDAAHESE